MYLTHYKLWLGPYDIIPGPLGNNWLQRRCLQVRIGHLGVLLLWNLSSILSTLCQLFQPDPRRVIKVLAVRAKTTGCCQKEQRMAMAQRRGSAARTVAGPCQVYLECPLWCHTESKPWGKKQFDWEGMGLSNGADMGASPPIATTCQSSTIIWSPCLGVLGAVFWETEQGAGGSKDRFRGMWSNNSLETHCPLPLPLKP